MIVGGGIVGLATAYRLLERFPGAAVTLLEKEKAVGQHQTGHNSGVLHSGLYYKPGSVKARLAVLGIRQMVAFCQENAVPHEVCGKLVVAADESEVPRLRGLEERGTANGLEGLRWLTREEMREIEPHAGGVAALRVPQEGIVDYPAVCAALVARLERGGARVITGARVQRLRRQGAGWVAETPAGAFAADFLINCAGLHCDRVAELAGERREVRILPFRGEYYKIRPERQHLVRNLIYPTPDTRFPFLGVHFTRLIHGGIEAGPNAVLAFAREGYRRSDVNLRPVGRGHLVRWDATRLPLADDCVDAIASNPPFGVQLGEPEEMGPLYRKALCEYNRVLRPGGRAVFLVADHAALKEAAQQTNWKSLRTLRVRVLGQQATLSVWRKN